MLQFVCDTCSAVKQPEEIWIVGQAAEAMGVVSARREVKLLYIHWPFTSAQSSAKMTT
jgi:hypothetical protein